MDPVTHAASGAVAMLALTQRPATIWALPLAALACASPDIDLVFCETPLDFLLIHRGITHSFAGAPVFGLLLALCCYPLWRKATPGHWKFYHVWLFCIGMILLHVWLDIVTTYGTMVFLPFSHYRVRLNSLYIIDILVTAPLLWALARWRARKVALLALAWTFLWPATGIAINAWHTSQWRTLLSDRGVSELHVLPDVFSPFFWRVIFEENTATGPTVREFSLNFLGESRAPEIIHPGADKALVTKLMRQSISADVYFHFAMLPVMDELPKEDKPEDLPDDATAIFLRFYDLRFGSGLEFMRKLLALRPNADLPFQFMLELEPGDAGAALAQMTPERVRLRFSDSGRDSHWHYPSPETKPAFWQWLVGLR